MKFSTKGIKFIPLTSKSILERVSEEEIFSYYLGQKVSFRKRYRSPLRDDKSPSCGFYVGGGSFSLMFKDFSIDKEYNCFSFVQDLYGLEFKEALAQVNKDFNLKLGSNQAKKGIRKIIHKEKEKSKSLIQIRVKDFTKKELTYWALYGISEATLRTFNVFSVDTAWIGKKFFRKSSERFPMYAFYFPETQSFKLYSPLSKSSMKWRSNVSHDLDIYGLSQLDKDCQEVYLTSSLKDVMALHVLGLSALAMQSESPRLPDKLYKILTGKKVFVLFDNDQAGQTLSAQLLENYPSLNLINLKLPFLDAKDPSDHIKIYGKESLMSYVNVT